MFHQLSKLYILLRVEIALGICRHQRHVLYTGPLVSFALQNALRAYLQSSLAAAGVYVHV